ncbi:MAG: amidohydrolase [Deltaproteobacteria bacterium]|nr:amidohydrolase [Deltaproteobacteria bacterium]MBW2034132.1 amidohydrolase [Deltaproteobacteria bacterium]
MKTKSLRKICRRDFLRISGLATVGVLTGYPHVKAATPTADLVLTNGKIITVDPVDTITQGVAVKRGRILELGKTEMIKKYVGRQTKVVNLRGKTVTPGLIDSHAHLPFFGLRENGWFLNLQGVRSKDEILELLAERARKNPKGEWISAWGVESLSMSYLNKDDLDRVTTEHPMLVVYTGGQWGFANSYALRIAGIDKNTPNPPGSKIGKNFSGKEPTGLLIHYPALHLVRKHMPAPDNEQAKDALLFAAKLYAAEGVTSVHDNFFSLAQPQFHKAYFEKVQSRKMPIRIKLWPYMPNLNVASKVLNALFESDDLYPDSKIKDLILYKREVPELFSSLWGGFKMAVDGGGPTTIWYSRPGVPLHKTEELHRMFKLFHNAGHQVSTHAVGDKAVDMILDAIEAAHRDHPREDCRHRIEHALSPQTRSLERIKRLGVVICTHPQWLFAWGDKWTGLKRREDYFGVIPLKSYLKSDIPLAIGADPPAFPVYQPQVGLAEAVNRITRSGYRFDSSQSISIQEALRIQTMGSAYAGFQEKDIGSIEKGKHADMVVWNRDFYTVSPDEIKEVKAEVTIVGGKLVYKSNRTELSWQA